jgi:protease-4
VYNFIESISSRIGGFMPRTKTIQAIWSAKNIFFFIILPLLIGLLLSAFIPSPKIGIITIDDAIDSVETDLAVKQIRYAENHSEIRAVLLILNCPGGTINGTELIYLELLKLRQTKPIVTMVQGLSASGAYYISAGTNYIFANPSSMVGNIGVIGTIPSKPRVFEEEYSTGPYKFWGWPQDEYIRQMDMMKSSFLQAVLNGRGTKLKIGSEQILRGEIYPANEAYRLGLIDELGPLGNSIDKAAEIAHISHYQIVDLQQKIYEESKTTTNVPGGLFEVDEKGNPTEKLRNPGLYFLYIPDY